MNCGELCSGERHKKRGNKIVYNIKKPEVSCSTPRVTENLVRDGEIMESEHSIQLICKLIRYTFYMA